MATKIARIDFGPKVVVLFDVYDTSEGYRDTLKIRKYLQDGTGNADEMGVEEFLKFMSMSEKDLNKQLYDASLTVINHDRGYDHTLGTSSTIDF